MYNIGVVVVIVVVVWQLLLSDVGCIQGSACCVGGSVGGCGSCRVVLLLCNVGMYSIPLTRVVMLVSYIVVVVGVIVSHTSAVVVSYAVVCTVVVYGMVCGGVTVGSCVIEYCDELGVGVRRAVHSVTIPSLSVDVVVMLMW